MSDKREAELELTIGDLHEQIGGLKAELWVTAVPACAVHPTRGDT